MKIIGRKNDGQYLAELSKEEAQALHNFCGLGIAWEPGHSEMDILPQIKLVEGIGNVTETITFTKDVLKKYIDERFDSIEKQSGDK